MDVAECIANTPRICCRNEQMIANDAEYKFGLLCLFTTFLFVLQHFLGVCEPHMYVTNVPVYVCVATIWGLLNLVRIDGAQLFFKAFPSSTERGGGGNWYTRTNMIDIYALLPPDREKWGRKKIGKRRETNREQNMVDSRFTDNIIANIPTHYVKRAKYSHRRMCMSVLCMSEICHTSAGC